MDINLTLIGQMITFSIFVWFMVKYIWPPMICIMEARRKKISDGLLSAEKGTKSLELANIEAKEIVVNAKKESKVIINQANKKANSIVEEGKLKAYVEGKRLLEISESEVEQKIVTAKESLKKEISHLIVLGVEHLLRKKFSTEESNHAINQLLSDLRQ